MQRKPFRIETLLYPKREPNPPAVEALSALVHDGEGRRLARGAADLAAAMEAIEKACHVVLGAAERVDEKARRLEAAPEAEDTRALARDIRTHMARIYELCNFHDLAGQRIAKVIDLLTGLDERLSSIVAPRPLAPAASGLINGPRLDGASGHVSQDEVDALFG